MKVQWLAVMTALMLSACGDGGGNGSASTARPEPGAPSTPTPENPAPPSSNPSPPPDTSATTACDGAAGRVLQVGPGQAYAVPSAAAAVAQAGDVIKIAAGDYHGDVAAWRADRLTICGAGGRARLFADGNSYGGKAIWVVSGADTTIDSLEFHDAAVPDENGAGIRDEHTTGDLKIINSGFFDNENGLLQGIAGAATITIDRSEFARSSYLRGTGYTHNLYIGELARLTVTNSFFHEAHLGHNLKSRAQETHIENSYFMDGPDGDSSYLADFPNGGVVYLRGNLFQKGPNADNPIAISFGEEGMNGSVQTLEMVHNTVVMTRSGGSFLSVPLGAQSVKLTANLFAGTGSPALMVGGFANDGIAQQNNLVTSATNLSGADNIASPNFWPAAALLAQTALANIPDPGYTRDAPQPFQMRAIVGNARYIGALQAQP